MKSQQVASFGSAELLLTALQAGAPRSPYPRHYNTIWNLDRYMHVRVFKINLYRLLARMKAGDGDGKSERL
jgi:hypothetical protein